MANKEPFDPAPHIITVQGGKTYLPVAARILWFRSIYPHDGDGRHGHIEQKIIAANEQWACVHTRVTVTDDEGMVVSSSEGLAQEFHKNFADHIEKCGTASLGRALGALGFGTNDIDFGESKPAEAPRGGDVNIPRPPATQAPYAADVRTPRVTHGGGDPQTPKQFGFLKAVAREKGLDDEALNAESWRLYEKVYSDLTKSEMSAFIDVIKSHGTIVNTTNPQPQVINHGGDDLPGHSLNPNVDVASNAAEGMSGGALRFWSGKVANMATDLGVTQVLADAEQRFGRDGLHPDFLAAVEQRRRDIEGVRI